MTTHNTITLRHEHGQACEMPLPQPDEVYDAGDLGCGDGPLSGIARKLKVMPPGAVLEIRSTDPGVAADLPSWCRMVGHEFLGGGVGAYAGQYRVRRTRN